MTDAKATIDALLSEQREFEPSAEFRSNALWNDPAVYEQAAADPEAFWARQAETLEWSEPWTTVMEWNPPWVKWFVGGKLNVTVNCLDRHLANGGGDKVAYYWEGEPGEDRTTTYRKLYEEVCRFANGLKSLGVRKGDRVAIYLGMVPELPVAMLACARIGAPHSVVFGGFSASALRDRINDAEAKVLITGDGSYRRGNEVPLKRNSDDAVKDCPTIEHVVTVRRTGSAHSFEQGRDIWYHDLVKDQPAECDPEPMDAEDMLYILYTSGTTGKPKGIVHTTGGYLTGVATTHKYIFDIHEDDVYWCAADIGWVTGHSYIVYGPLANHTTGVMYEGAPDWPDKDRLWSIVAKRKVSILYTAPTAIRAFMRWGPEFPQKHDLSSLRLLGTVGEPINPEAWVWYWKFIGTERCPVVDTWWQTETGSIMITPLPGITTLKPGSATHPFPGIEADIYDEQGKSVAAGQGGYLVLKRPWPAMFRTIYGDPDRYVETYFKRYGNDTYLAGDGAKLDDEGYYWLLGRIDDVMNVAGHRISTYEVESALVDNPKVAEAAVVAKSDEQLGQAITAFVTLKGSEEPSDAVAAELREHVAKVIGKIARPQHIIFTDDLPKTRSGKIMRRLLRDVAEGRALGDVTTLANAEIIDKLKATGGSGEE
ncbi:MAG TPA: acetate--CoA ligase [Actinobacteria bacterium]|jgi:acetyl-CoA synthetase|nr:acetate--CoA ligase [Actinomycetota bacterium]